MTLIAVFLLLFGFWVGALVGRLEQKETDRAIFQALASVCGAQAT